MGNREKGRCGAVLFEGLYRFGCERSHSEVYALCLRDVAKCYEGRMECVESGCVLATALGQES